MKLLFDQNLSPTLAGRLADIFPQSTHVQEVGLDRADDAAVWNWARTYGFIIVSKDSDFHERSVFSGTPPKVVWLRRWTHPTRDAEHVLRRDAIRITGFAADPELAVLVLDRD